MFCPSFFRSTLVQPRLWFETLLRITSGNTQQESLLKAFAVWGALATRGQPGKKKNNPFPFVPLLMLKYVSPVFSTHSVRTPRSTTPGGMNNSGMKVTSF